MKNLRHNETAAEARWSETRSSPSERLRARGAPAPAAGQPDEGAASDHQNERPPRRTRNKQKRPQTKGPTDRAKEEGTAGKTNRPPSRRGTESYANGARSQRTSRQPCVQRKRLKTERPAKKPRGGGTARQRREDKPLFRQRSRRALRRPNARPANPAAPAHPFKKSVDRRARGTRTDGTRGERIAGKIDPPFDGRAGDPRPRWTLAQRIPRRPRVPST